MFRHVLDNQTDLRLLEERHVEDLSAAIDANRAHLVPWMTWAEKSTLDSVREYIRLQLQNLARNDGFCAGIFHEKKIIGSIGFHRVDWINRKSTIGYWIAEGYQGRGIVTRATRALVDFAFSEWKLHRIEIWCAIENIRSAAIPMRLGFTHEGTRRGSELLNGRFHDAAVYSILAPEWPTRTAAAIS